MCACSCYLSNPHFASCLQTNSLQPDCRVLNNCRRYLSLSVLLPVWLSVHLIWPSARQTLTPEQQRDIQSGSRSARARTLPRGKSSPLSICRINETNCLPIANTKPCSSVTAPRCSVCQAHPGRCMAEQMDAEARGAVNFMNFNITDDTVDEVGIKPVRGM